MLSSRRGFLFGGGAALLTAPAIVRVAGNLMPVSTASRYDSVRTIHGYDAINDIEYVRYDVLVGGQQWGLDQQISGIFPTPKSSRVAHRESMDRLFVAIEQQLQRPVYAAELIKPGQPPQMPIRIQRPSNG